MFCFSLCYYASSVYSVIVQWGIIAARMLWKTGEIAVTLLLFELLLGMVALKISIIAWVKALHHTCVAHHRISLGLYHFIAKFLTIYSAVVLLINFSLLTCLFPRTTIEIVSLTLGSVSDQRLMRKSCLDTMNMMNLKWCHCQMKTVCISVHCMRKILTK